MKNQLSGLFSSTPCTEVEIFSLVLFINCFVGGLYALVCFFFFSPENNEKYWGGRLAFSFRLDFLKNLCLFFYLCTNQDWF